MGCGGEPGLVVEVEVIGSGLPRTLCRSSCSCSWDVAQLSVLGGSCRLPRTFPGNLTSKLVHKNSLVAALGMTEVYPS